MSNDNARNIDRAWDLIKKIGFAVLVTRDGNKLRARPIRPPIPTRGKSARHGAEDKMELRLKAPAEWAMNGR